MPEVWIAADTLDYPTGGGHLWAYLNWALGLRSIGCDVVWLEPLGTGTPTDIELLRARLAAFGIERVCLLGEDGLDAPAAGLVSVDEAAGADLLLNLAYGVPPRSLKRFSRTALLDIDPGMTQTWIAAGDVDPGPHDVHLTIGEGVAAGTARVPDCGVSWHYVPPCVSLEHWPAQPPPPAGAYTTITHWWGDASFVTADGDILDNTKRSSFLPYLAVARDARVEICLAVAADDLEEDAALLAEHGWSAADPVQAAGTPERYQAFIRASRGEFSCAKPAYRLLSTGWISDRTVCYLASGRPAIVQDTGRCRALDDAAGAGVHRFASPAQAAAALRDVERDPAGQSAGARKLAEERFDARAAARRVLELSLD